MPPNTEPIMLTGMRDNASWSLNCLLVNPTAFLIPNSFSRLINTVFNRSLITIATVTILSTISTRTTSDTANTGTLSVLLW